MAAVAPAPTDMVSITCPHCTLTSPVAPQAWGWLCRKCGSFYTFRLCKRCGHAAQVPYSRKQWTCPSCGGSNGGMLSGGKGTSAEIFARDAGDAGRARGVVLVSCAGCKGIMRLPTDAERGACARCGAEYVVRVCGQCGGVVQAPAGSGDWTCTWCRRRNPGSPA